MLGGLATSSLCEFVIRPGLFLMLSRRDALRLTRAACSRVDELQDV